MLVILHLAVVVSALLGVDAGEASFQAIGQKLVESVHLGRYDDGLRDDDVTDYVNAAEVWDNDEMLNLLGLDKEEETKMDAKDPKDFDTATVPTLLSTLYQELNDPKSKLNPVKCRMPGIKGNVVRMLNSKGKILSQTQRTTVVELQFSMKNVLQPYENITEAKLKLSASTVTHIGREVWDRMSGETPQYKYEIYFAKESDIKKFRKKLVNIQTSEQDTEFFDELGKPLIVEYISNIRSNKKLEINMKPLVKKWRKRYFEKKGRAVNRGILVVTMETDLGTVTKQCFRAMTSNPRLLLVSQDRRQCPLPVTSYDDVIGDVVKEKGLVRQKRETRNERKRKKERTKKTNDTKSVFDVPVSGFKYGHPDPVSEKHSDDVTGDVIKEGGHKRQDRGTRKRKKGGKGRKKNRNDTEIVLGVPVPGFDAGKPDPVRGRHTGQSRTTRSTICRRYPMYIRFDEVGWGRWIIAPRGYQAYRCAGECPFPLGGRLNGTNHAVLMTMMHSVEPWSTPQPCCVPTVLAPISLLYFDTTGNVVLRQYEDMVVSNCGCR